MEDEATTARVVEGAGGSAGDPSGVVRAETGAVAGEALAVGSMDGSHSASSPEGGRMGRAVGPSLTGMGFAVGMVAAWAGVLTLGFALGFSGLGWAGTVGLVLLSTLLHTGLFITVHDALHGTVCPRWPRLNVWVGRVVARLYAGFSWRRLREKHLAHHRFPGTERDPDHHAPARPGVVWWYSRFIGEYVTVGQIVWMAVVFNVLSHGVGVPEGRLLVFWVVPALLSTVQLFVFGTWLPHRRPVGGHDNVHHARTNDFPEWLSLLTCFHFGYHLEHHEHPAVPWWRLPALHRRRVGEGKFHGGEYVELSNRA